jgi:putative hemolysin
VAFALVVIAITYLTLVVGELVPKRIALQQPEGIAALLTRPMRALSTLALPIVNVLSASTDAALRLIRVRTVAEPTLTEEEIRLLIEEASAAGVIESEEEVLVERIFHLGDRRAVELMTPRHRVDYIDVNDSPEQIRTKAVASPHTVFPVCDGGFDNVRGIVSVRELWAQSQSGEFPDPRLHMREPLYVPETTPVLTVLERFKTSGRHKALVVDEFGMVSGLLTVTDILEGIVGDLGPLGVDGDRPAVQRPDGSWLLDGALTAEEVSDLLNMKLLPGADEGLFETLGGFVMARLGRIPEVADYVEWQDYRFEVVDMDGNRVDKVLASVSETDRVATQEPSPTDT